MPNVRRSVRPSIQSGVFLAALILATAALIAVSATAHARLVRRGLAAAHFGPNAELWFQLKRAYPTGRLPAAGALDRAWREIRPRTDVRTAIQLPGDRWVSIGPQPIAVQNSLPFAGRVTAVAPHPTLAGTLYIGTDSGGIWKTTDGGSNVGVADRRSAGARDSVARGRPGQSAARLRFHHQSYLLDAMAALG